MRGRNPGSALSVDAAKRRFGFQHLMTATYHFTFERDWRTAPVAFWVHVPVPDTETEYDPPAPAPVLHEGYAFLHVVVEGFDLQFSAPAQLDHFIDVLCATPLPTSRQLSARRGLPVGPNGHWLSRLPAKLKAPRKREKLVRLLLGVRASVVDPGSDRSFGKAAQGRAGATALSPQAAVKANCG